jgi:hypothetical protein
MNDVDICAAQSIRPGARPGRGGVARVRFRGSASLAVMAAAMPAGGPAFGFFSPAHRTLPGVVFAALSALIGAADDRAMRQSNACNDKLGGRR